MEDFSSHFLGQCFLALPVCGFPGLFNVNVSGLGLQRGFVV